MSNATVVNATNSSGLSAGSPITIETGGDVEFVAAGKFTGAGFVTIAFAPYVGDNAGAPTLITITSEIPLKRTSALGTGATQFVGWVADASGTWEASGVVIGDSDHEALSGDLGTFPDVATMPTKAVKTGATAKTTAGVPYSWGGAGWALSGAVTVAKALKRYDVTIPISGSSTYVGMYNDLSDGGFGAFIIPANTFGPGMLNPIIKIKGFLNINPNGAAINGLGVRVYVGKRYNDAGAQTIATTDLGAVSAAGPSRFCEWETTIMWTPGSDVDANLRGVQSYTYSCGLITYGAQDDNGRNIDLFDNSSGIDWTVDQPLYIYVRTNATTAACIVGSREAYMTFQ